jgi:hypothetical protein
MKLPDITAWLASARDFAQGAALYAALGPSATYKRLFALPATDYAQQVLARELATLVPPVPAASGAVSLPVHMAAPPTLAPPVASAPAADSPLLTHLRQELKAVRDLRSHVHPQLTAKGMRRTERQQIARTIVALTDKEVEFLATIAHVQEHGRLPGPVPTAEVTDPGELRRRLQNARSLRSKLRDNPERAADFAALEAEISLILSKLKLTNNG